MELLMPDESNEGMDPFSNLPIPIFHHILSFLPSKYDRKEVITKLSLVSRSWLHACCSYPILDFYVKYQYRTQQQWEPFVGFVDDTMTRFQEGNVERMQRFKLCMDIVHDDIDGSPPVIDKWIDIALDNHVQDLYLGLRQNQTYKIPTRVLSSGFLKSMSLRYKVSLPPSSIINLYSLRSLEISYAKVDNKDFQRLLRGCPLIENLTVRPDDMLEEIVVSGLKHIKTIDICKPPWIYHTIKVKVEAATLETLCLKYVVNVIIICPNLKCLKWMISGSWTTSEEGLHKYLSKFPLLEMLELHDRAAPKRLKMTKNPMLKKLEITITHELESVVIYSNLKVLIFRYKGYVYDRCLPRIAFNNPPFYFEVHFENDRRMLLSPSWYLQLSEMLYRSGHRSLSITFTEGWENDLPLPSSLPLPSDRCVVLDELSLFISGQCSEIHSVILNNLFTAFHPSIVNVTLVENVGDESTDFTKFLCENIILARKGECGKRSCWGQIKCWKHKLKEVKIEGIKGSEECGPLDSCRLFELLPTLKVGNKIRFRLQWVTYKSVLMLEP